MPGENSTVIPTGAPEPTQPITQSMVLPKPSVPPGFAHLLSRETWVKFFILAVPIIFTAGALYVTAQSITARQDEQDRALQAERDRTTRMESDQRVMATTVQSISTQQDKMSVKIESIDDKLDAQGAQLSAISERLGARPRR